MTQKPDTIVVLMTYNHASDLPQCLDSLANQTYKNFHMIVVDDVSSDSSFEIVKSYEGRFANFTAIKNEKNRGAVGNLHFILELAKSKEPQAEFILWASPDDWWAPQFLEKTRNGLIANPQAVVCFSDYEKINMQTDVVQQQVLCSVRGDSYAESRKIFRPYKTPGGSATFNSVIHGLIRFSELHNFLPSNEQSLMYACACELSILVAMLMRGQILIIPEILFYKRQYGRYADKHPTDRLAAYYRSIFKRPLIALWHLPRLIKMRRSDRSLLFAILMWMNLFYIYGVVSTGVMVRNLLKRKSA